MKLIADMHTHTNVSHHAFSTLSEMCAAAAARGLKLIALTNHAPALPDSAHRWHFDSLPELPRVIEGVYVLRGAEVNILNAEGEIDLREKTLAGLDFIVASFHSPTFPEPDRDKCTRALEAILKNPYVKLLGHMGTPAFEFDYEYIISRCAENGKAVELNGSSVGSRQGSKPRCVEIARLCKKYQVPVMIDSDSHFSGNFGLSELAVAIADEAGLPEEQVLNADWDRLCDYLAANCGVDPRVDL